jgi:peptide/nickel transport system ATP-binding protein
VTEHPLLEVRGLRVTSRGVERPRTIVSGLDLQVSPGETVGIVGESGSGKSLTARAIIGLLPFGVEASGEVRYRGVGLLGQPDKILRQFRGSRLAMVFQDPYTMLNPLLRSGRHIEEGLYVRRRGHSRTEGRSEAIRRLAEVGIVDPAVAELYPFQLSGGMRQRVALAAALARDPELLIADEPSTALDVTTQAEILALLKRLQQGRGMGVILITHDLRVAFSVCDRIYVLYAGSLLEVGDASAMEQQPLHPYTLGLLLSDPPVDRRLTRLVAIDGAVPAPDDVENACAFAPRCRWADARCRAGKPPLISVDTSRQSACLRLLEIRSELVRTRLSVKEEPAPTFLPAVDEPLIRVEALVKVYRTRRSNVQAIRGVSLEIGPNEAVGIVGESGSGKTTLARCLVGLERPSEGKIVIDGIVASDFGRLEPEERSRIRRTVQIVFQDPYSSLNPALTVRRSLKAALRTVGEGDLDAGVEELLTRVGLPTAYGKRKPASLSGGERQRVAIARSLAVQPRVLVCDEPVSALDVSVQAQILNLFRSLRHDLGLACLFITHDLAVVRQVVDRVYVMYRGEIVESGLVDDVLDRPRHPYTIRLLDSIPRASPQAISVEG